MLISFGECRLDFDRRELRVAGRAVNLTPKAFEVLRVLVENRARAVSRSELFERVWPGVFVSDDSLARAVAEIRGAIGDTARRAQWLRTIHGYGYAFAAQAETALEHSSGAPRFVLQCGSRQFPLTVGEHVIGREPSLAMPMHSPAVSRRHAAILITHEGATLTDLGSKNGTFVGDRRIDGPCALRAGDTITVGNFTLVFTVVPGAATETVPL
jgi:DNA-binding winged helix-turn-helix (wHTH) protein